MNQSGAKKSDNFWVSGCLCFAQANESIPIELVKLTFFLWTVNFSDSYIISKLVKSLPTVHNISTGGHIFNKVHSANLLSGWDISAKVRIFTIDGSLQTIQANGGCGGKVNIAETHGCGLHQNIGNATAKGETVDM